MFSVSKILVCLAAAQSMALAQTTEQPIAKSYVAAKSVQSSDLMKDVQIIGKLGVPLWKMTRVRGHWIDPGPGVVDPTLQFAVTDVDGKKLNAPIMFDSVTPIQRLGIANSEVDSVVWDWKSRNSGRDEPPKPMAGQEWDLLVIETGGLVGYPDDVSKEAFPTISFHERGFLTRLQFIRVRKVGSSGSNRN